MEFLPSEIKMNALAILSSNLSDLISLDDPEAAEALNNRIIAWNKIDELQKQGYVDRGLIALCVERRQLWKYMVDPDVGVPFSSFTAWMACSEFMGCRRTNFEAYGDMKKLADVPPEKLIGIEKYNIKALLLTSTAVRNDPAILEAAIELSQDEFLSKMEREHPLQHLEARKPLRFNLGRSQAKDVQRWIDYALDHDIAGTREEAIVMACSQALYDAELDSELAAMPIEPAEAIQ
jgi:hypothetical protein